MEVTYETDEYYLRRGGFYRMQLKARIEEKNYLFLIVRSHLLHSETTYN